MAKIDKAVEMATKSDYEKKAWLDQLDAQPATITGYYVMDSGEYGGEFIFDNNKDKLEIHWPKNVVDVAPPALIPAGMAPFWDKAKKVWELKAVATIPADFKPFEFDPGIPNNITEAERLALLPMPKGKPQKNAKGHYPVTVLNEFGTAWVWKYPDEDDQ